MSDPCTEKDRIAATEKDIKKLCTFQGETESSMITLFKQMDGINKKLLGLLFTIYGCLIVAAITGAIKWAMASQ